MIKPALQDSNVNLCFLEKLGEKKRDKNLIALINFRNCGINTVHNAIKNEEVTSVWKVESKSRSLYKISEDSPRPVFIT